MVEFKHYNEITATGPIVRKGSQNGMCWIIMKILRPNLPNKAKEGESLYCYPNMACFGELAKEVDEKYQVGDTVTVRGVIDQKKVEDDKRDYYDQRITLREVKEAEKVMKEFECEEGDYVKSGTKVKLGGYLSKILIPSKHTVEIFIRTYVEGRVRMVQVIGSYRQVQNQLADLQVGTPVFVMGEIYTPMIEEEEGKRRFYQSIRLSGICKAG